MSEFKLTWINQDIDFYHVIQPIMNIKTEGIYGYEVLLRSQQLDNPEYMFNKAREQNQLINLDISSLLNAFRTFQNSVPLKDIVLFVNVFPSTLVDPSFDTYLKQLKALIHVGPRRVVFEINEAEKEMDMAEVKKAIKSIRQEGFQIALDDIGKGGSTLKAVLEFEPEIAKVDRYFVQDLAESPKKQRVLRSFMTSVGADAEVIAEGFETDADLQIAKELGITYGQGFFLGRPKPVNVYLPEILTDNYRQLWRLHNG